MNDKIKQFMEDNINKHLCKCGCGNFIEIKSYHHYYGIPKYIQGHQSRVNPPMKGKHQHLTDATKQKMREAHFGKKHTKESCKRMSGLQLKFRENQRWNNQVDNFINGNPITDWIAKPANDYGISQEAYNIWRRSVYKRDRHTCRICGANHCLIHAHHIIPQRINQDLILEISNGITMCRTCHELTYGKEEIYSEELQMIVDGKI